MVWHTVWFWSPIVLARASDIANMWSPHALGCSVCSAKTVVSCRPQSNALSELKTYQWFWLKPQWTMIFRWYFDVWIGHVGWFWAWSNLERPVQTLVHHVHLPLRLMLCMFTSSWRLEPHARNIFLLGDWKQSVLLMKSPPCLLMSILNQYVTGFVLTMLYEPPQSSCHGLEVLQAAYENRWCNLEHIGRNLKISRVGENIELWSTCLGLTYHFGWANQIPFCWLNPLWPKELTINSMRIDRYLLLLVLLVTNSKKNHGSHLMPAYRFRDLVKQPCFARCMMHPFQSCYR